MRAREFLPEGKSDVVKTGIKMNKDHAAVIPGAHRVAGTQDRHYDLNKIMQYVAASDGKNDPDIDVESWAGRNNVAIPYTPIEAEMLRHAYRLYGNDWDDILKPNSKNKSVEPDNVHKVSPVKGFKGF